MLSPCREEVGDMSAPGGQEQHVAQLACFHLRKQLGTHHRTGTAAAGTPSVNILLLPVIDEQAAVLVLESHAAFPQKLFHQLAANLT